MIRLVASLAIAVLGFACGPAFATFHLWTFSELFSSADGKVQFLEMRTGSTGQQFVSGHSLSTTGSAGSHSFVFPNDLPGDTGGKTMVIATASFAALGVVTPDFIVPDNFFSLGSGSINFAGVATWSYSGLPADGSTSLNFDGTTARNSPKNFAGQTGSVTVLPTATSFNVQGLWWNDPDNSEGGWGVNIAHQGSTLFVSWFTYDADGSNMWLYMDNAVASGANTYTGNIYRATGAPFSAYTSASFHAVPAGTGTFTFSDSGHGTFQYTVNGTSQTKTIKRYVFGTLPICDQSGAAATNFTDLWWRSPATSEVGWGVNLIQQGDIVFLSWFTYDANGKGMWVYGSALNRTTGNTFTGQLARNTGNAFSSSPWSASSIHPVAVGTATVTFADTSNGTFTYTLDGTTQSKPITRFGFATPVTTCR